MPKMPTKARVLNAQKSKYTKLVDRGHAPHIQAQKVLFISADPNTPRTTSSDLAASDFGKMLSSISNIRPNEHTVALWRNHLKEIHPDEEVRCEFCASKGKLCRPPRMDTGITVKCGRCVSKCSRCSLEDDFRVWIAGEVLGMTQEEGQRLMALLPPSQRGQEYDYADVSTSEYETDTSTESDLSPVSSPDHSRIRASPSRENGNISTPATSTGANGSLKRKRDMDDSRNSDHPLKLRLTQNGTSPSRSLKLIGPSVGPNASPFISVTPNTRDVKIQWQKLTSIEFDPPPITEGSIVYVRTFRDLLELLHRQSQEIIRRNGAFSVEKEVQATEKEPGPSQSELKAEVKNLQEARDAMKEDRDSTVQQLQTTRVSLAALQKEKDRLQSEYNAYQADARLLTDLLWPSIRPDPQPTPMRTSDEPRPQPNISHAEAVGADLLKREQDRLKAEITRLRTELERANSERSAVCARWDQEKEKVRKEREKERKDGEERIKQLQDSQKACQALEKDAQQRRRECETLKSDLRRTQDERDQAKAALSKVQEERDQAKSNVSTLQGEHSQQELKLVETQGKLHAAEANYEQANMALARLRADMKAIEELRREMEQFHMEKDKLSEHVRLQAEDFKAELERLRSEKDTELERLRSEKDTELERLRAEKDSEIERLRAEKETEVERVKSEREAEAEQMRLERASVPASSVDEQQHTGENSWSAGVGPRQVFRWKMDKEAERAKDAETRLEQSRTTALSLAGSLGTVAARLESWATELANETSGKSREVSIELSEVSEEVFALTGRLSTIGIGGSHAVRRLPSTPSRRSMGSMDASL